MHRLQLLKQTKGKIPDLLRIPHVGAIVPGGFDKSARVRFRFAVPAAVLSIMLGEPSGPACRRADRGGVDESGQIKSFHQIVIDHMRRR